MKKILLALLAGLFVCIAVTAVEAASSKKTLKDTLVVAAYLEPGGMDPQSANRTTYWLVQINIYDKLLKEMPDGTFEPRLAHKWEFIDDLTIRFYLRDDVKFHNGEPFVADDVLYTLQRGSTNPLSASAFQYFDVANSKVIDPHTFELKLKRPYAAVFNTLATGRGCIVNKKTVEAMGDNKFARSPVGTGPYKMVEWISGTEIRLVRNDDYWGKKAITKNVIFKFIPEASSRIIELETGGADVIYEVSGKDIKRIEEIEGAHILKGDSSRYMFVTFSMKDKTLANKDLRYALSYALDKDALVKACYGEDAARTATGFLPATVFGHKDTGVLPYDLEKARELMKKAGYENGLTLKFLIEPRELDARLAEAIQNMWSKIGLKVEIFQMVASSYTGQGHDYQIGLRTGNSNEPSGVLIVYDPQFAERLQPNDDTLTKMLRDALAHYDPVKRAAAYGEIQDYLYDKRYSIPLAFVQVIYGVSDKVENFECEPQQLVELYQVSVYE